MILILYLHHEQCYGAEGTNGTYNALPSVRGGQDYQYQYGETMSGEDGMVGTLGLGRLTL